MTWAYVRRKLMMIMTIHTPRLPLRAVGTRNTNLRLAALGHLFLQALVQYVKANIDHCSPKNPGNISHWGMQSQEDKGASPMQSA